MKYNEHFILPKELPAHLPLLLIRGAVLLPKAQLPLPIFDPSHFSMITDALQSHRLLGLIQPKFPRAETQIEEEMELFTAGTAGRIMDIMETDDGTLVMTLEGVCRFSVTSPWETKEGYPTAQVSYKDYQTDMAAEIDFEIDRPRLFKVLKPYFKSLEIFPDWEEIYHTSNEKLVTALTMVCPFEPSEKQALLEGKNLTEQSKIMMALIEMETLQGLETLHHYH